jgi:hypothetical protein
VALPLVADDSRCLLYGGGTAHLGLIGRGSDRGGAQPPAQTSGALPHYREWLAACPVERVPSPTREEVLRAARMIHPKDAAVLAAAMRAGVNYLVTLDRRHFLDDPEVARRSGLRIGTPGDFIAWFRALLERK